MDRVSATSRSLNTDVAFVFTDLLTGFADSNGHSSYISVHILFAYNSTVEMQSIKINRTECKELNIIL